MINFKKSLKRVINAAGYDVRRFKSNSNPAYQLFNGLNYFNINLVLDIGANIGQFANQLRSVGYQGEIVSFEPLTEAFSKLSTRAARDDKWRVHSRGAIGDYDGEIEINIAGNSVSSSVLSMLEAHSSAAISSAYVTTEQTPIYRLDSVASDYVSTTSRHFIKIDTQGFEWQVLNGATDTLATAQGVLCELSLVPLYQDQRLWLDMIRRLEAEGFMLWSIQKGFTDPRDGRTLQIDAIFFRNSDSN